MQAVVDHEVDRVKVRGEVLIVHSHQ